MRNRSLSMAFAALLLMGAMPAQATPMTTLFGGFINEDNGNPFGATFGDTITGSATFDDIGLPTTGTATHALTGLSLTSLGFNFPLVNPFLDGFFSDGALTGIFLNDLVFDSVPLPYNIVMTGGPTFDIFNLAGDIVLGGCLDFGTGVCTDPNGGGAQVPEPGTLALFGIGLLGFFHATTRRRYRVSATKGLVAA